jgi:hypothetical protein
MPKYLEATARVVAAPIRRGQRTGGMRGAHRLLPRHDVPGSSDGPGEDIIPTHTTRLLRRPPVQRCGSRAQDQRKLEWERASPGKLLAPSTTPSTTRLHISVHSLKTHANLSSIGRDPL